MALRGVGSGSNPDCGMASQFRLCLLLITEWSNGMLVLSRKKDEVIMIGDDVVITVVDIRGDKVRLGICAPSETPVHRQEVYEAIEREKAREGK